MAITQTPRFGLNRWGADTDPQDRTDFVEMIDAIELTARLESLGRRNVIRNGDMRVAQRGGGALAGSAVGAYTLDGWLSYVNAGTLSVSQGNLGSTFQPFRNYLDANQSQAAAAAGDYMFLAQRVEDVRTHAGQQVTLSFYASPSVVGRHLGVSVRQFFGTGGAPSATVDTPVTAVQLTSPSLARYTVTFTVPSIAGKTIGSNEDSYLELRLWMGAGATNQPVSGLSAGQGTQATWRLSLTGVQLETGPDASPFERLPVAEQLAWCQRYFVRLAGGSGSGPVGTGINIATNTARVHFALPVPLRASYSATLSGTLNLTSGGAGAVGFVTLTTPMTGYWNPRDTNIMLEFTTSAGVTVGYSNSAYFTGGSGNYLDISAEL